MSKRNPVSSLTCSACSVTMLLTTVPGCQEWWEKMAIKTCNIPCMREKRNLSSVDFVFLRSFLLPLQSSGLFSSFCVFHTLLRSWHLNLFFFPVLLSSLLASRLSVSTLSSSKSVFPSFLHGFDSWCLLLFILWMSFNAMTTQISGKYITPHLITHQQGHSASVTKHERQTTESNVH